MRLKRASSRVDGGADGELKDIVSSPENGNKCGECGNPVPTWCSTNLGVFLCGRCASVHRKILGTNPDDESGIFSNVKSLSMERWDGEEIDSVVSLGGNKGNQKKWNPRKEPFPFDGEDDKSSVETFIRNKYVLGKFRYDEVMPSDFGSMSRSGRHRSHSRYDNDDDDRYDDYGMPRNRSRSRSLGNRSRSSSFYRSGSSSHLSKYDRAHQKFGRELRELRDRGYTNEDDNINALTYSHGDVPGAIEYLRRRADPMSRGTSRSNAHSPAPPSSISNTSTSNPPLPTRKPQQGPKPAIFDGTNVIQPGATGPTPAVFDGSVQQYYDPATGMVYVDQQQYMLAMQQQQQQQAQLTAQMTAQMTAQQMQPQVQYGMGMQAQQQPIATGMAPAQMAPQYQQMAPQAFPQQQYDKNAIMNLYNRPDQYTTPVEITPNHPQYQQIMQQQFQNQQFGYQ